MNAWDFDLFSLDISSMVVAVAADDWQNIQVTKRRSI
jgi:hypothetical protein